METSDQYKPADPIEFVHLIPDQEADTEDVDTLDDVPEISGISLQLDRPPINLDEAELAAAKKPSQHRFREIAHQIGRVLRRNRPPQETAPTVAESAETEVINLDYLPSFPPIVIEKLLEAAELPIEDYNFEAIQLKRQLTLERLYNLRAEDTSTKAQQRLTVEIFVEYAKILKAALDNPLASKLEVEFPGFRHQEDAARLAFEYIQRALKSLSTEAHKNYNFTKLKRDTIRIVNIPKADKGVTSPDFYLVLRRELTELKYIDQYMDSLLDDSRDQAQQAPKLSSVS